MNSPLPLPGAGAVGMGMWGRDLCILTILESRRRTLGQFWRRREESVMWGEGSELSGEGERERKKEKDGGE